MGCSMLSSPKANSSNFDAAEFYAFASWLNHTKPSLSSQVLRRTIIGRAYYAALICASSATGAPTHGKDGHVNVVRALKQKDLNAGNKLDSLRLTRQNADYKAFDISSRDVDTSLQAALVVLKSLGKAPSGSSVFTSDFLDPNRFLSATAHRSEG